MDGTSYDHVHVTPKLHERRERVFLVFAGIFLGAMAMLNIIGITKFISVPIGSWWAFDVAVGVLPYPLTFLCTDFISEFYGRRRANFVVCIGVLLNVLVISVLWVGNVAKPMEFRTPIQRIITLQTKTVEQEINGERRPVIDPATGNWLERPASQAVSESGDPVWEDSAKTIPKLVYVEHFALTPLIDESTGEPILDATTGEQAMRLVDADTGNPIIREETLFSRIFFSARSAVLASMLAYLAAQFCDVFLFHFWKSVTRGKHLWLRNNGSTMISQMVDTTAVVLITFWGSIAAGEMAGVQVFELIGDIYLFKVAIAAIDTIPFYVGVRLLRDYLKIDPTQEHHADLEESAGG
jgi:uncharacterized PurR-regulated membrane protein YhhQ (DUF165 family)